MDDARDHFFNAEALNFDFIPLPFNREELVEGREVRLGGVGLCFEEDFGGGLGDDDKSGALTILSLRTKTPCFGLHLK